jgi:autotransporter-associated beta strand protein
MKTMKNPSLVLLAAIAALSGSSLKAAAVLPYSQDFLSYAGTAAPSDFVVEWVGAANPYEGASNGSGSTLDSGFYSFGNNASTDRSFGIMEGDQGAGDIGDSRLFLRIKNESGSSVTRLRVRYKVQVWRDGARQNAIRLKYSTDTGSAPPSGFSGLPDLANTPAKVNAGGDLNYDGTNPTYYTQVDTEFNLTTPLADGSYGWLRWQYSTAAGSGRRDGLGIDDIIVEAVPTGTDKAWKSGSGNWDTTSSFWASAVWSNAGNYNAVFSGSPGTVSIVEPITAVDLKFTAGGYTVDRTSSNDLTLKGRVNVDDSTGTVITATIAAPIAGSSGLLKTGPDTLELSGASTYAGTTAIDNGKITLLANNVIPSGSTVQLADTGKLDLNGYDLTVNGLQGDTLGEVILPTGSDLTLNTNGNFSYKGNISGAGNLVKIGTGRQRLRNTNKTYTGATDVDAGILEITENGLPAATSSFSLDGSSTEVLLSSDTANFTYRFGPASPATTVLITNNAALTTDTGVTATITNAIDIGTGGGTITARGTSGSLTLNGAITGSGALTRKGQAPLVINGNSNTYTGNVLLSNGLTTINSGKTLGAGSITVTVQGDNSSEKASLRGPGSIGGSLAFGSDSLIDLAAANGAIAVINGNITGLTASNVTITGTATNRNVYRVTGSVNGVTGAQTLTGFPAGTTVTVVSAAPSAGFFVRITK